MGHGELPPGMKVPDASIYKLENAIPLMKLKEQLAKEGLKDPWLRNHVWKYDARYGTTFRRSLYIFRGFGVGVAAFLVTLAIERSLGIKDYHGPHEGHH